MLPNILFSVLSVKCGPPCKCKVLTFMQSLNLNMTHYDTIMRQKLINGQKTLWNNARDTFNVLRLFNGFSAHYMYKCENCTCVGLVSRKRALELGIIQGTYDLRGKKYIFSPNLDGHAGRKIYKSIWQKVRVRKSYKWIGWV